MALLPSPPRKYKAVLLGGLVLVMLLVLGAIFGDRGLIDLQRLRAEERRIEELAFQQQQANAALREHLDRLRSDDRYLERVARRRLRWAKPDEVIYSFAGQTALTR
ncbi:MAG: septum formation initiator family protein [Deltaproteobacteria bacterium]|nr:septum formation initiator family protein [Deltaproteobacteria bacterium]